MKTSPSPCENEVNETTVRAARSPLRNGNRQGDFNNAPRCGAKTRAGTPCKRAAMRNAKGIHTRCAAHGGKSTGAKSAEGLARIANANTKHGKFTKAAKEQRRLLREIDLFWACLERDESEMNLALALAARKLDIALSRGDEVGLARHCRKILDLMGRMSRPIERIAPVLGRKAREQDAVEMRLRAALAAGVAGLGCGAYRAALRGGLTSA